MKDRVALITGASRGIGKAIALELAASGVKLALTARSADALEEVAVAVGRKGGQAVVLPYDLSDFAGIPALVEKARKVLGPVNMLVNNAGIYKTDEVFRTGMMEKQPINEGSGAKTFGSKESSGGSSSSKSGIHRDIDAPATQEEQESSAAMRLKVAFKTDDPAVTWRRTLDVNLTAPFELIRAVVPSMIEKRWGRIINVSSISGLKAEVYGTSYSASKFGLIGLTQALALELAKHNITVNAVCPGWVNTQMAVEQITDPGWCKLHEIPQSESLDIARLSVPQGRFIEPEEVAHLVAFLLTEKARGITGQSINICGGLSLV
jgi:Dehydrogenases with different specificities (related to short-chain alcohol dehydrogenases)